MNTLTRWNQLRQLEALQHRLGSLFSRSPIHLSEEAMMTNESNNQAADGLLIQPAADAVAAVEPEDLSRFEGEGGPEAPMLAVKLIDVPLEKAIWRRPSRAADQTRITR